jgi:ArsR family metal-binding transcriptional regulator
MLLKSYTKEIFNNECMLSAMSVQCFAHLNEDVGEAIPYLNASLGGHTYTQDPPSETFKVQGKLITVHSKKIVINALKDEEEATKIIEWLKREINAAWKNRGEIERAMSRHLFPRFSRYSNCCPKPTAGNAVRPPAWSLPQWWQRAQKVLRIVLPWMILTVKNSLNI